MRTGTKSVLFGVHCFFIHPMFVLAGWIKLYGFPWHPLIWLSILIHDWGYFSCKNMDDNNGEMHPYWGSYVVGVFGGKKWADFCLLHSRFLARRLNETPSKLCFADKYSIILTPAWLYIILGRFSGEIYEYIELSKKGKFAYQKADYCFKNMESWYKCLQSEIKEWIDQNK